MNRKKEQIQERREFGKASLYRRGRADSVTRLGRKLSAGENRFVCAVPSYSILFIKLPVFNCLYFYKHSSGYFLFFPASGFHYYTDGGLSSLGTEGDCWTSTPNGGNAWYLRALSHVAHLNNVARGHGFSVRCVQASALVFAFTKDTFVFFPASGNRSYSDGKLGNSGLSGYGWTSTPAGSNAWYLDVWSSNARVLDNVSGRFGFPVRCVQASAAVFAFTKNTFVFFPAAGVRRNSDGVLYYSGVEGDGWTSTPADSGCAYRFILNWGTAYMGSEATRTYGFPVRCVQASAAVFAFTKDTFCFFPAAGIRDCAAGSLANSGAEGNGWTSVPDGNNAFRLIFKSGYAYVTSVNRDYGFPVRCVQASAAVWITSIKDAKQIRYRREFGKAWLCRRGRADSVTRLGRKLSARHAFLPCAALSHVSTLIRILILTELYFYKHSSGYSFFFPASGYRSNIDGGVWPSGENGHGWTSTPDGGYAWYFRFLSDVAHVNSGSRGTGFTVRCVQASATVWFFQKENRKQIRFRRESGKACLCRRGRADSVTRLGRKFPANENHFVCAAPSYSISLIKLPVFNCLYFYKHSSGYFLFFPASGYRYFSSGSLVALGMRGYGWVSSPYDGSRAWGLFSGSDGANMYYESRGFGFPVRCVQASVTGFVLFFPASGYRGYSDGKLYYSGTNGYGWTSAPYNSGSAWGLSFYSGNAYMGYNGRGGGFPVRCVQASAAVFAFTKDTIVFFPASGFRNYSDGMLYSSGAEGDGWTSASSGSNASYLRFLSGIAHVNNNNRGNGLPVRCVQASASVFASGVNNNEIINADEGVI